MEGVKTELILAMRSVVMVMIFIHFLVMMVTLPVVMGVHLIVKLSKVTRALAE
jgi:hypothetical protein